MSAQNEKPSAKTGGKEIPHPRRILAVSLTESAEQLSAVIKDLTGTHPSPQPTGPEQPEHSSLAGTTHHLPLSTQYYTASVPIWLDLISSPSDWSSSFLSEEAKEVLDVLGGVIVVVDLHPTQPPSTKQQHQDLVRHVGKVVKEGLGGWDWDGVSLAVGVGKQAVEDEELDEWEDVCAEGGLEFVHFVQSTSQEKDKRNEYGERMGIARVLEALEANDWSGGGATGEEQELDFGEGDKEEGEDEDFDFNPKGLGFGFDREDFEGLKKAIWEQIGEETEVGEGSEAKEKERGKEDEENLDDDDIKNLEQMMLKLQAVRDMSAGLPEQQRKRMAKQAVEEVMRDL
ncbi:hypothetical protein QBC40DRAFT_285058 [Triangularia verruculosa]|uniref:Alpha and gamma adaptin binding protein p34 n=1 Tax=Triangularia verruculosa TaxID=2587418 RepID=A0AAN6XBY1_9PEZI|nr:hypothetical protein QBC40DRAFT_285058 [Triangularia verruculosa]